MAIELSGSWLALPWVRSRFGARVESTVATLVLFGILDLGFAASAVGLEVATGHPLLVAHAPSAAPSFDDALWHMGTAFLLALPFRNRAALWIAPVLGLGFDVDHIFGTVLPTVVGRTSHAILFVALASVVLYYLQGRSPALVATGVVVAHLAVDGGSFPWFGPVSTSVYSLPLPLALVMLPIAATIIGLGVRSPREIVRPSILVPAAVTCAIVGSVLALVPFVSTWSVS